MIDFFGADADGLLTKKLFLLDMDGTIYEEDRLFDGATDFLKQIRANGGRYVFITNNSSKSVEDYIQKVRGYGIAADRDDFFTSAQATIMMLKSDHPHVKVYCQGTRSLLKELRDAGIDVTENVTDDVGLILVGYDTELTSEKMRKTCLLLKRNLPYYATNPDFCCPVSFGYVPDCGAMCQMYEHATKKKPIYIGKPEPTMVTAVMQKFGASKEETVVIGDRLYTDIASGLNAGVTAVLVLSGEATVADIDRGDVKPSLTFSSVKDILNVIK